MLDNDANLKERNTENYKIENEGIKQCDFRLIHSSITSFQPTDSHLLHPNTPSPRPADSDPMF